MLFHHYKWRAMRANGVAEHLVTGTADDWKKFAAWAATVPHTQCNPLYHWTHLELKRYFSIADCLLNTDTAREIYNHCSALLQTPAFSMRAILTRTILYVLNLADNEVIATMVGNFQDGSVPGKIQFGSGWWFNDQKDGMQRQIKALSNMGLQKEIERRNETGQSAILACSALKRAYRELLGVNQQTVRTVYLKGSFSLLQRRLAGRRGHFMPPELLRSQLETLEVPGGGLVVDIDDDPAMIVTRIIASLQQTSLPGSARQDQKV